MEEMAELIDELDQMADRQAQMAEIMRELGRMAERQVEISSRLLELKELAERRVEQAIHVVAAANAAVANGGGGGEWEPDGVGPTGREGMREGTPRGREEGSTARGGRWGWRVASKGVGGPSPRGRTSPRTQGGFMGRRASRGSEERFKVGERVRIRNPNDPADPTGRVVKVTDARIHVETDNGVRYSRADKNIARI